MAIVSQNSPESLLCDLEDVLAPFWCFFSSGGDDNDDDDDDTAPDR